VRLDVGCRTACRADSHRVIRHPAGGCRGTAEPLVEAQADPTPASALPPQIADGGSISGFSLAAFNALANNYVYWNEANEQSTLDRLLSIITVGRAIFNVITMMNSPLSGGRPGGYREVGFSVWQRPSGEFEVTVSPAGPFHNTSLRYEYPMRIVRPANCETCILALIMHTHPTGTVGGQHFSQVPGDHDFRAVGQMDNQPQYAAVISDRRGMAYFYDSRGRRLALDRPLTAFSGYGGG
jgi:hypothetical protein